MTEINQYLKFNIKPTMINKQDNLLALAGLDGDLSLMDARNFNHVHNFNITDTNNITNYVGFIP